MGERSDASALGLLQPKLPSTFFIWVGSLFIGCQPSHEGFHVRNDCGVASTSGPSLLISLLSLPFFFFVVLYFMPFWILFS
jgi:hypothetical protein